MMTVAPPEVHPSLGLIALMHGVAGSVGYTPANANHKPQFNTSNPTHPASGTGLPSVGSNRLARRPCLELLCTNMLSETASRGPSTLTCDAITTCNQQQITNMALIEFLFCFLTWFQPLPLDGVAVATTIVIASASQFQQIRRRY